MFCISRHGLLSTVAALAALAAPMAVAAQVPQYFPLPRTLDLLVVDSGADAVWRLSDRNQDGDFNDFDEIARYYDDVTGSITLTNPTCVTVSPLGTAYVGDSTEDIVLALRDLDVDGDCLGAGEATVFFDSASNAGGIVMASIQGITVDAIGNVFCAVSNAGSTGVDMILRLTDRDGDGDANDAGEASVYCQIPNAGGAVGDSIPTVVIAGPDGSLYYADVGATGVVAKGVYRLTDLNFDGDCNDPGEVNLFWSPPAPVGAFYWGLAVDRDGWFYITDHGNETVWRGKDLDNSGFIDPNEETLFYRTARSTWWGVAVRDDGTVILCEDDQIDRLTALTDRNSDGDALDPGEAAEIYDVTVGFAAVRPRGATFVPAPSLTIQPSTVAIGQPTTIRVGAGKPGESVALAVSAALIPTPIPVPPIGFFELQPTLAQLVLTANANAQASFDLPLTVPNDASLIGAQFAFQALAGDRARSYLTNGALLRIR